MGTKPVWSPEGRSTDHMQQIIYTITLMIVSKLQLCFIIKYPYYANNQVLFYKIDGSEGPIVMSPSAELFTVALLDDLPVKGFKVHYADPKFGSQVYEN